MSTSPTRLFSWRQILVITAAYLGGVLVAHSIEGQEYFHDALAVTDPVDFLRRYNELQPTLHRHAHTHPPGAVLTLYFLEKIFGDAAIVALAVMLLALIPTVYFFYRL